MVERGPWRNSVGSILWPDLASVFKQTLCRGEAKVDIITLSKIQASMETFSSRIYTAPGRYARLTVGGRTMMSNSSNEKRTCAIAVQKASGRVLVAGLGIGMILFPMARKLEVDRITVIEKSPDVIELVAPFVKHRKIEVIEADIFDWVPERTRKWNTIWFDIWPEVNTDNLAQIALLHNRYKGHLDRTGLHWMGSWCEGELRSRRRNERREAALYTHAKALTKVGSVSL